MRAGRSQPMHGESQQDGPGQLKVVSCPQRRMRALKCRMDTALAQSDETPSMPRRADLSGRHDDRPRRAECASLDATSHLDGKAILTCHPRSIATYIACKARETPARCARLAVGMSDAVYGYGRTTDQIVANIMTRAHTAIMDPATASTAVTGESQTVWSTRVQAEKAAATRNRRHARARGWDGVASNLRVFVEPA